MPKKKINKRKFFLRLFLITTLLVVIVAFVGNRYVKKYGFDNLGDFISTYFDNKSLADKVEAVNLKIDLKDSDYQFLADKRDEALNRGVQINVGDNYVPCKVSSEDSEVIGEIRLKGHMTDHLEGDKWSFRVKTENPILGMYRFSLQHPGTRNYIYEWIYHQLLANEGIIHLNYDFLNLSLNDKDLGIYAIEEHFGQHVLEHNNRPKGAILRWNPGLYWEWRIDELNGDYLDEDYSSFSSSYAEPYDKGVVKKDPELIANYQKGAQLLEAFRRDSLSTSEVFDVELMARFHAIIDLVGGYHSLDWSDVKFYYNSESNKIEPIGYESFSVRETERIAGQRIPNSYMSPEMNYHDKLFSDPIFFEAYIQSLERICDEQYFSEFQNKIGSKLDEKLGLISKEWPYRKFSLQPYFRNIDLIRNNIELPKPFHAFINSYNDSIIELSLAAVSDFPIELLSLEINGKKKIEINNVLLKPKTRDDYIQYQSVFINHSVGKVKNVFINARIPGGREVFRIEVNEFPSFQSEVQTFQNEHEISHISTHVDIKFSDQDQVYYFDSKIVLIAKSYNVAQNEHIRILPGQKVVFEENGRLVIEGELEINGDESNEIIVQSETVHPVIVLNYAKLQCSNIVLVKANNFIESFHSEIYFQNCTVADVSNKFIHSNFSDIHISKSIFGSANCIGEFDQSKVFINEVIAKNGEVCFKSNAAVVRIEKSDISNFNKFCNADHISKIGVWDTHIEKLNGMGELNNGSFFKSYQGIFEFCHNDFIVDNRSFEPLATSSNVYYKTDISKINQE